jgi:hypothetical protein
MHVRGQIIPWGLRAKKRIERNVSLTDATAVMVIQGVAQHDSPLLYSPGRGAFRALEKDDMPPVFEDRFPACSLNFAFMLCLSGEIEL